MKKPMKWRYTRKRGTPLEATITWECASAATDAVRTRGGLPVLSRSADTQPPERLRASRANELAVDLIVAFSLPRTDVPGVGVVDALFG